MQEWIYCKGMIEDGLEREEAYKIAKILGTSTVSGVSKVQPMAGYLPVRSYPFKESVEYLRGRKQLPHVAKYFELKGIE